MIRLSNISKSYGTLTVLSDISLTIGKGEIITIVGPSGAGKTTLLQIAGSLDRPDSGENCRISATPKSALYSSFISCCRNLRHARMWRYRQ